MVGAGDDDPAAGGRIVLPIVLTGWNDPRQNGGGNDARRQQRERMGQLQTASECRSTACFTSRFAAAHA
jgi:hypothetical protein